MPAAKTKTAQVNVQIGKLVPSERAGVLQFFACRSWFYPTVIVLFGMIAYSNSLKGVWLFDDVPLIVENYSLRSLPTFQDFLERPTRFLTTLTLTINYLIGGNNIIGYHVFNVTVHLLSALILFHFLSRTFVRMPVESLQAKSARGLAFAIALLWAVHPLCTQAVTYVIQRGESLMSMFYLLTLYCTLRGATAALRRHEWAWYHAALACCGLAMLSKEVAVTLPVVAAIYDRVFLARSWADLVRRRWWLYAGFFCCIVFLLKIIVLMITKDSPGASAGLSLKGVTPFEYARSEPLVILHYLRLVFFPYPLCLDYAWLKSGISPLSTAIDEVVLPCLGVFSLVAGTGILLWRRPAWGFWGAWFFIILAPTSSVMPIADLAVEHRMYLPLVGVLVLAVLAVQTGCAHFAKNLGLTASALRARLVALLGIAALACTALTVMRNEDYSSAVAMWQNVLDQNPMQARAAGCLGVAYFREGAFDKAEPCFELALEKWPELPGNHLNYGVLLLVKGKTEEAIGYLETTRSMDPAFSQVYHNLGLAYLQLHEYDKALELFRKGIEVNPHMFMTCYNINHVLSHLGRYEEAEQVFEQARKISFYADGYVRWGSTLLMLGRDAQAMELLSQAQEPGQIYETGTYETLETDLAYHAYKYLNDAVQGRAHFANATKWAPAWSKKMTSAAWELATHPDPKRREGRLAVFYAEKVNLAAQGSDFYVLDTLAAAYAERGLFKQAVAEETNALDKAKEVLESKNGSLPKEDAAQLQMDMSGFSARLELYKEGKPFRDERAIAKKTPAKG